ncbi:MAG: peptidyl-prolyl cis-trans isomerase [Pseudomonadota bacterium]
MMLKPARLMLALIALAAAPAFAQAPAKAPAAAAAKADVAATVNGKVIPVSKIEAVVKQVVAQGKEQDSPRLRTAIRNDLIGREVLIQEADKQGYGTRPEVKAALDNARQSIIINAMLADYVRKNPPKDAEVKAEYDAYKAQRGEKEYRVRHILVATEDEAKALIAKLKAGSKFEDLAKASGKDATAPNGGELPGWVSVNDYVPEFTKAMAALQKGAVTDVPVKTQHGFHVIKLEETRPAKIETFETVKQQAVESVQQKKLAAFRDDLMKKATIK